MEEGALRNLCLFVCKLYAINASEDLLHEQGLSYNKE